MIQTPTTTSNTLFQSYSKYDVAKQAAMQYLCDNRYVTAEELLRRETELTKDECSTALLLLYKEEKVRVFVHGETFSKHVFCLPGNDVIDVRPVEDKPKKKKVTAKPQLDFTEVPIDPHSLAIISKFANEKSISSTAAIAYLLGKAVGLLELVHEVQAMPNDNRRGV